MSGHKMPFDKMAPNSKEYATTDGTIIPAWRWARCEYRARPIVVSQMSLSRHSCKEFEHIPELYRVHSL